MYSTTNRRLASYIYASPPPAFVCGILLDRLLISHVGYDGTHSISFDGSFAMTVPLATLPQGRDWRRDVLILRFCRLCSLIRVTS